MSTWKDLHSEIQTVTEFEIKRSIDTKTTGNNTKYSLLCFCDASIKAYAAAVYLHEECDNFSACDLVFSKSRLSPVKGMTIPRLELMAVLIGVRCLKFVENELRLPLEGKFLWSDSQCVLKWINTKKELSVFVRNRITEIKIHSDIKFAFIPTSENPADVATRGTSTQKLGENRLWWHGPEWISLGIDSWKEYDSTIDVKNDEKYNSEVRKSVKICNSHFVSNGDTELREVNPPYGIDSSRFSSLCKMIRVTAWVTRFISGLKRKSREYKEDLTATELQDATKKWCQFVQRKHYSDVRNSIMSGKGTNIQRQLGVFIGEDGLLRCRGRLENSDLSEGAKYPILLPKYERFTELLIQQVHVQQLHCGISQTLSRLRYKYWIPQGRTAVRQVLRKCLICKKYEGGPYKMPTMAPLPKSRVSQAIPFTGTGLDYLGPIFIRQGGETKKRWICLFTCVVIRAVHLEVLQNMTTDEFLYAFRRFVLAKGTPTEIISDNATQFKLGCEVVNSVWKNIVRSKDVQNFASNSGIRWEYITERIVGLVKRSLRKSLNKKLLSEVQLQTTVKEIEAVLNTHPLVYIGEDINSRITLTPNHFLSLNPYIGVPNIDYDLEDPSYTPYESSAERLVKIWKKGQKLLDLFWKMWREDYLMSLRERMQTSLKCGRINSDLSPQVGDVVILKDDVPRGCWKLGRIVALKSSRDNKIRSVKVRLASGKEVARPLNLLYPIETSERNKVIDYTVKTNCEAKPKRKAFQKAREKIKEIYSSN